MLLPCEDNCLRNITLDRPAARIGRFDQLPCDIDSALVNVIEQEIALQRRLDILKRDLECRFDFSTLSAYRSVDKYNDGRIDTFNLGSFLRSCGHYASERELLSIVRRMDTDGDARLSYAEFADFVRSTYPPSSSSMASTVPRASSPDGKRATMTSTSYSSPLKSSTQPRAHSAARASSPIRSSSPVRSSPIRGCPCSLCTYYPCRCAACCSVCNLSCCVCKSPSCKTPVRHSSPVRHSPACCSTCRLSTCCCPVHRSPARTSPAKKAILHVHEEDSLVNGLRDIISLERELESTKVSLTNKVDFNLHDAFRIFDVNFSGSITAHDVREGLAAIGVFPSHDEVDLFVKRYDANRDFRLTFSEFSEAFLSSDSYYSHQLNRRGSNHRHCCGRRDDCFYVDTQAQFRDMWRVHFKVENAAEAVRQRLQRNPCFNVYEAFNSLDLNDDGRISSFEIKRLIESRGFYVSEKEASSALKKFDANKDGSISYGEVS